jgi:hypothetical protein
MSASGLAVVAVIYMCVAFDFLAKHNYGMAWAFVCYAGSNVGFIYATMKGMG